MKFAKACRQCRVGKRKCGEVERGGGTRTPCAPCLKRGLGCSLAIPPRRHPIPILPPPEPSHNDESQLDPSVALIIVNLYLQLIHNKPHTLFHAPSLLQAVEQGTIKRHVLYGLLALTVRFAPEPHTYLKAKAHIYFERAQAGLKEDLEQFSVENVQTCVLIGNYCGVEGSPQLESLYVGIASRTALITRLANRLPGDDDIQHEVKLRCWWSLYMMDRWGSAGHHLPRQIPDHCYEEVLLPMDELAFDGLQPGSRLGGGGGDEGTPRPGLWGRMVQLASIFTKVHDLHRARVQGHKSHREAEARTHEIAVGLNDWSCSLPPSLRPTPENMRRHAYNGLGSAFVALHMGYYHYSNLLYFPFLDLQLERTSSQGLFAERCRQAAASFSDLLTLSNEMEGCEVVYFIVAHMTIVSSAALLHVLLFGHETELPATRKRLEANFKTLVKLRGYWPAVGLLMERLFTFQRACLRSTDANTHKADSWMVEFLLDHARPIAEKVESPGATVIAPAEMVQRDRVAVDTLSLLRA